ncbi:unnamed protein product [Plasmodium vivax]|uniref:(malaria parasite P. vivax) hypothetical protein n=1 Tax=Plasmodium vivax TaxID=5855 RepID=A0A8S4HFU3_PLAVI|nr:unnamed protein product [Plasmodium vivax]
MMLLHNYNFKDKIKHFLLFKIVIFIILLWIYDQNYVSSFVKSLDIIYNNEIKCNTLFNRSLAQHEIQRNSKYQSHRGNLYDNKMNKNMKDDENNKPTYEYLKKGLNDLESYKKDYNRRYAKKKGLAKLDCYYEKKIFNKIDEIYELSRKVNNSKKALKKEMYKKFVKLVHSQNIAQVIVLKIMFKVLKELKLNIMQRV